MDVHSKVTLLTEDLDRAVERARVKRERDKAKAFVLRSLSVALAAAITVLLGFEGLGSSASTAAKNAALVCGALITVFNAWDAFFNHRGLWIMHTISWVRLMELQQEVGFYLAGRDADNLSEVEVEAFWAQFVQIQRDSRDRWINLATGGETPAPAGNL